MAEEFKCRNYKNGKLIPPNSLPEKDLNDSNVNGGRNGGTGGQGNTVKWRDV